MTFEVPIFQPFLEIFTILSSTLVVSNFESYTSFFTIKHDAVAVLYRVEGNSLTTPIVHISSP